MEQAEYTFQEQESPSTIRLGSTMMQRAYEAKRMINSEETISEYIEARRQ